MKSRQRQVWFAGRRFVNIQYATTVLAVLVLAVTGTLTLTQCGHTVEQKNRNLFSVEPAEKIQQEKPVSNVADSKTMRKTNTSAKKTMQYLKAKRAKEFSDFSDWEKSVLEFEPFETFRTQSKLDDSMGFILELSKPGLLIENLSTSKESDSSVDRQEQANQPDASPD